MKFRVDSGVVISAPSARSAYATSCRAYFPLDDLPFIDRVAYSRPLTGNYVSAGSLTARAVFPGGGITGVKFGANSYSYSNSFGAGEWWRTSFDNVSASTDNIRILTTEAIVHAQSFLDKSLGVYLCTIGGKYGNLYNSLLIPSASGTSAAGSAVGMGAMARYGTGETIYEIRDNATHRADNVFEFHKTYHVAWINNWNAGYHKFYVDGNLVATITAGMPTGTWVQYNAGAQAGINMIGNQSSFGNANIYVAQLAIWEGEQTDFVISNPSITSGCEVECIEIREEQNPSTSAYGLTSGGIWYMQEFIED